MSAVRWWLFVRRSVDRCLGLVVMRTQYAGLILIFRRASHRSQMPYALG